MAAMVAAFHFIALGMGSTGIVIRARSLKAKQLKTAFFGDNLWGIAALLWIVSGLLRAFGSYEKGSTYYLQQPFFWVKMLLFTAIVIHSIWKHRLPCG